MSIIYIQLRNIQVVLNFLGLISLCLLRLLAEDDRNILVACSMILSLCIWRLIEDDAGTPRLQTRVSKF